MKIRTEPLLGAAMFGIAIQVISNILSTVITYNSFREILSNPSAVPNANPLPTAVSVISCLAFLVAGIGTGVLYAILHSREEPLTGSAAKGGAAAGAIAFGLSGVILGIMVTILIVPLMNEMTAMMMAEIPDAPTTDITGQITGFGILGGLLYAVCGGLISAVIGAILGAIGGVFGGMFAKSSE